MMPYTIITLGNRQKSYNSIVANAHSEPEKIDFCNGKTDNLAEWFGRFEIPDPKVTPGVPYGYVKDPFVPKLGELGVWFSQMSAWQWAIDNNSPIIIVEDDAITADGWLDWASDLISRAPDDWHVFSYTYSDAQVYNLHRFPIGKGLHVDWGHLGTETINPLNLTSEPDVVRMFQTWQAVAWAVSPAGAKIMLDKVREDGIINPIDCWVLAYSINRVFNGYTVTPTHKRLIVADMLSPTNIHDTENYV